MLNLNFWSQKTLLVTTNEKLPDAKREIQINTQQIQAAKREIVTINKQLQNTETKFETNNQQLQSATMEIAALRHENSALKAELQVQSNVTTHLSGMYNHCS